MDVHGQEWASLPVMPSTSREPRRHPGIGGVRVFGFPDISRDSASPDLPLLISNETGTQSRPNSLETGTQRQYGREIGRQIPLKSMVGVTGFEPATPTSRT